MHGVQHTTPPSDASQPSESVAAEGSANRLAVPPWIQLVGLPLIILFVWLFATAASHAVVVFVIAGLISLLLNPIVRAMIAVGVPRSLAVLLVFSVFSLIIAVLTVALVDTTATQAGRIRDNLPAYGAGLEQQITKLQHVLDHRKIGINLRDEGIRFVTQLEQKSTELSTRALDFGRTFVQSAAAAIFTVVLVIVVTIYMLLDAPRIGSFISSITPRDSNIEVLYQRLERSLLRYVMGQSLASLVMAISATIGLYILGITGLWPEASDLAIVFGLIVAITQFAPSIGAVLGSIPPIIAAAFSGFVPMIAVTILFILLHQIEGHLVIPKLMGAAIAVHPLLVIFGILAGAQIMGIGGILLAIPLLAVGREIVLFVRERVQLGAWPTDAPPVFAAVPGLSGSAADPQGTDQSDAMGAPMARIRSVVRQRIRPLRARRGRRFDNDDISADPTDTDS